MQYKNVLIIMIFVVTLFSISSVYAEDSDLNESNVSLGYANENSIDMENKLNLDDETNSFSDLNNEISQATTILDITKDYTFNPSTDGSFIKGVSIYKKDLTINGNNHCIDANNQASIFDIFDSGLIINNLTLKNAKGHAIYSNYSDIITNNVIFTDSNGSAFCGYNTDLISNNDIFINNYAEKGASIYLEDAELNLMNGSFKSDKELYWGLIYVMYTNMTVLNTEFYNITSKYSPAIFTNTVEGRIKNCKFVNLYANMTAGALAIKDIENSFTIENCSFYNVSSRNNGGAIFVEILGDVSLPLFLIKDSQFNNCSSDFGGAILQLGGKLQVVNSNFTDNFAKYKGGAIYSSNTFEIFIKDSQFYNNTLVNMDVELNEGCAIFADRIHESCDIQNSNFIRNSMNHAGAIYLYDSCYDISNSYFKENGENIYTIFDLDGAVLRNNNFVDGINRLNQKEYKWVIEGNNVDIDYNPIIFNESLINASYFNLGDYGLVTAIKDQHHTENCWVFGAATSLELALLKATGGALKANISVNNIVYYVKQYSPCGVEQTIDGGDGFGLASYFLSWLGGNLNEDSSFDELGRISIVQENMDKFHLNNVVFIPPRELSENSNLLKEALIKYGSVIVTVNAPNSIVKDDYNNKTFAAYYYAPIEFEAESNHIVTLVGWNDTYSKENFIKTPPGDGAWILQISWGSEWGNNGYYYVSYYDTAFATLSSQAAFVLDENYPYTKNYQYGFTFEEYLYDGIEFLEATSFANVYEATGDDLISAVGTFFNESAAEYTILISVNGKEVYSKKGNSLFRGFQTIKLDSAIAVNKGDKFMVKIQSKFAPFYWNSRQILPIGVSFADTSEGWIDFSADTRYATLKVYTVPNTIVTNNSIKYYADESPFTMVVGPNEEVIFEINGIKAKIKANENGTASLGINLPPGTYVLTAEYNGTKIIYSILIKNTIVSQDVSRGYNSNYNYTVQLLNSSGMAISNTKVDVTVNGKTKQYTTDSNGFITIPFTKLTSNQVVSVVNPITSEVSKNTIKVVSRFVGNKNINMYYFDGSKFTVKVYGDDAKLVGANQVVVIKLNKKTYKVKTNKKGVATLKIPKTVKPGTYTLKATYKGQTVKNTIKVKQVLTSKKTVNVKKNSKKLVIKAKLKNKLKGKKITFKFNGKTYKTKTNKKGMAKVTIKKKVIKKLKKGKKYSVKITYLKDTIKSTVKVKG